MRQTIAGLRNQSASTASFPTSNQNAFSNEYTLPISPFVTAQSMTDSRPQSGKDDKRRTTVRDIAAVLGLHFTTVAEALRDSPRVKEATKKRVKAAAERMGYQADPLLAALSSYRTQKRNAPLQGVLVWINGFDSRDFYSKGSGFYSECFLGAEKRSRELGYKLEPFWMSEPGMTPDRASQILRSRKASGVIVGPMPHGVDELNLFWDSFCSVRIGYSLKESALTTIIADQFGNARLLYNKLLEFGFQRIGFSCPAFLDNRTNNQWLAGYLSAQRSLPKDRQLKPFIENGPVPNQSAFIDWVASHKPDVIITGTGKLYYDLLIENGYTVPGDTNVVCLHADSIEMDLAGISQNGNKVGIASVDHLIGVIHRFKVGLETHPKVVTVTGKWIGSQNFKQPTKPT